MSREQNVRSVGEHRAAVLARVAPVPVRGVVAAAPDDGPGTRWLPLDVAAVSGPGLVLADDVVAATPVPGFDHAAVDGYAIRLADVRGDAPVTLDVTGAVRAGEPAAAPLGVGQAVRVMTGAPVPWGADAVVPVEATSTGRFVPGHDGTERTVAVTRPRKDNIRRRGEDLAAGTILAARGGPVTPALLAAAAASGGTGLHVRETTSGGTRPGTTEGVAPTGAGRGSRPRVAVVSTGSELRPAGVSLGAGGVVDSNSLMLAAIVRAAGAEPLRLDGVPDDAASLRAALDEVAADADLVVTTGGLSAGAWDVVRQVLLTPGGPAADVDLTGVAMRPGRPQGLATWRGVPWIALPGTPVAAFVSAHLFVRPAIARLSGLDPAGLPATRRLVGNDDVPTGAPPTAGHGSDGAGRARADRTEAPGPSGGHGCEDGRSGYVRVVPVRTVADGDAVAPTRGGGHALSALLGADGLALVPPGGVRPGGTVEVVPL